MDKLKLKMVLDKLGATNRAQLTFRFYTQKEPLAVLYNFHKEGTLQNGPFVRLPFSTIIASVNCCGLQEIGAWDYTLKGEELELANAAWDIFIEDAKASQPDGTINGSQGAIIISTTYKQPHAEALLTAAGFVSKDVYNTNSARVMKFWTLTLHP